MLLERLEESLVLLADRLCWPLNLATFVRLNSRAANYKTGLSSRSDGILRDWLWADNQGTDVTKLRFVG